MATFGTFTRDDKTRVASSKSEAVALRFNGWAEQNPAELAGPALDSALKAADLPTTGKADEKRDRLAASANADTTKS